MMPRIRSSPQTVLAAAALAALLFPPPRALAGCILGRLADLPVTMRGLQPTVPVKINGADAQFVVDSGSFYSTISAAQAEQFKLHLEPAPFHLRLEGIGGSSETSVATVGQFTLAGIVLRNVQFIVGGSDFGGLLGQNILKAADTEYDLANGAVRLWRPQGCRKSMLAYWVKGPNQPLSVIDINWTNAGQTRIIGTAELDGHRIRVLFDSGSGHSTLALRAAERAGFKPDGPDVQAAGSVRGIGSRVVSTWIATFPKFVIGGEEVHNARLRVGDMSFSNFDMLIGADFFLSHHIYIAVSQNKLYFTYNGGPVFNLSTAPPPRIQANSAPSPQPATSPLANGTTPAANAALPTANATARAANAAAPAANAAAPVVTGAEPTDAAGFARQGMAYAARHELDRALADLTRACELAPTQAIYFYQRGQLRAATAQLHPALDDFNEALKLDPSNTDMRVSRAALRIRVGDATGAIEDIQAADRLSPKRGNIRFALAELYIGAGGYAAAVSEFDLWLGDHAEDSRKPDALNGRCWARALWGQQLNDALHDCNKALRMRPGTAAFLDSRALVELRLGELDRSIGDYDAALRLQPKNAWILYSRGVAELRKGMQPQGRADIAAAVNLQPHIADLGRKRNVTP
jgi:tetratricopeptide (TPR) repeat protein/predicted aspartyl protease